MQNTEHLPTPQFLPAQPQGTNGPGGRPISHSEVILSLHHFQFPFSVKLSTPAAQILRKSSEHKVFPYQFIFTPLPDNILK